MGTTLVATLAAGGTGGLAVRAAAPAAESTAGGTLVAIAAMSAGRSAHTATLLRDGRVLVAGGFLEKGSANGAEAYDPVAGRFRALPPMLTMRHSHTATLLPNGRVLLAGGYGEGTSTLASAELFDPETNTFAPTGPLLAARADHVAVLLPGGKVLIASGLGPGWTFLASAELYDPATGRFSPTGPMGDARESHVGVLLQDGRVLVTGGHSGPRGNLTLHASAEVYEPAVGLFRRVGAMRIRRHKHDAALLPNGRVLVTGGADERDERGVYRSTEFFDPTTGTFSEGPSMTLGRYKHAGTSVLLPTGVVLVAGGAAQAETYDPGTSSFGLVAGDPRMAGQFSAVAGLGSGAVLITGGYGNGTGPRASAWLYRP